MKYLIPVFLLFFIFSCEKDPGLAELSDENLELRAKGGKPDKPGDDPGAIIIRDLGTAGGEFSRAHKIAFVNGQIHIVGNGTVSSGDNRGILWTEANGWQDLGYLHEGYPYSAAKDINADGTIVGFSTSLEPTFHSNEAVTWSINPVVSPTSVNPSSSVNSSIEAINNQGDLAGTRVDTCGYTGYGCGPGFPGDSVSIWSGFVWIKEANGYSYVDIPTLGGKTWAHGINDNQIVVGRSEYLTNENSFKIRAFVWEDGSFNIIPGLEERWSWARDVNNAGQIVGEYDTLYGELSSLSPIRGFITEKNEFGQWETNKLPTLGTRTIATAISESGYITGTSWEIKGASKGRTRTSPVAFLYHEDLNIPGSENPNIISLGKYSNSGRSDGYGIIEHPDDPNLIIVVGGGDVGGSRHALMWTIDLCVLIPGRCPG